MSGWNEKFSNYLDTRELGWKDGLTENIVELLEITKLEETSIIKTKCEMNTNDQNMQLTADQRHQDKLLLNFIND